MSRQLCIGIHDLTPSWKCLLEQIGVWFEEINYQKELFTSYSVIILNRQAEKEHSQQLSAYLQLGGGLLETGDAHTFFSRSSTEYSFRSSLFNTSDHPAFQHIRGVDLHTKVNLHHDQSLFGGLIHITELNGGYAAHFGCEAAALMQNAHYIRKRFFNPSGGNPDELVSAVSKEELSELVIAVLRELHFKQTLPFVCKWHSPRKQAVFSFRIDSDYGTPKSMDNILEQARNYELSLSWFMHVKAHEDWLEHFKDWDDQEIALHGYKHGTSTSYDSVIKNIGEAHNLLLTNGFNSEGYCAPYGIWNKALKEAISEFKFCYSSEFTFVYDGLPLGHAKAGLPLQLPVHPICTGSLRRQQVSEKDMASYFEYVFNNKCSRFKPVSMYHHPMQPGLSAVEHLFKLSRDHDLTNLTFQEYARFWRKRNTTTSKLSFEDDTIHIQSRQLSSNLFLQVSTSHTTFDLVPVSKKEYPLTDSPEFEYSLPYLPSIEEMKHMKKRNLSLLKTTLLDWKNRIRL
ncbi:MAG: hypothetical protein FH748_08575 [Balneolaceae bacterium]|nr:hypothetical protein [Balneolaceae bacterium]